MLITERYSKFGLRRPEQANGDRWVSPCSGWSCPADRSSTNEGPAAEPARSAEDLGAGLVLAARRRDGRRGRRTRTARAGTGGRFPASAGPHHPPRPPLGPRIGPRTEGTGGRPRHHTPGTPPP